MTRTARRLAASNYATYLNARHDAAETATNGHMLTHAAERAGRKASKLWFSGRMASMRSASQELIDWFEVNGENLTATQFRTQTVETETPEPIEPAATFDLGPNAPRLPRSKSIRPFTLTMTIDGHEIEIETIPVEGNPYALTVIMPSDIEGTIGEASIGMPGLLTREHSGYWRPAVTENSDGTGAIAGWGRRAKNTTDAVRALVELWTETFGSVTA